MGFPLPIDKNMRESSDKVRLVNSKTMRNPTKLVNIFERQESMRTFQYLGFGDPLDIYYPLRAVELMDSLAKLSLTLVRLMVVVLRACTD